MRPPPGARLFQVVPEHSLLRILVFRGGAFASAGHNHVIASHDVSGRVYLHPDIEKSAFELTVPLERLSVDEPQLRQEEGADFPPEVPESARQGTRQNMLGEALLEVSRYPVIRIFSSGIQKTGERLNVTARIGVKERWSVLTVPVALQMEGDRLAASGEFDLRQTDLGLKPFSVMMGALQVRDEMKIKFTIVATTP